MDREKAARQFAQGLMKLEKEIDGPWATAIQQGIILSAVMTIRAGRLAKRVRRVRAADWSNPTRGDVYAAMGIVFGIASGAAEGWYAGTRTYKKFYAALDEIDRRQEIERSKKKVAAQPRRSGPVI